MDFAKVTMRDVNSKAEITGLLVSETIRDLESLDSIEIVKIEKPTPEEEFFATADE